MMMMPEGTLIDRYRMNDLALLNFMVRSAEGWLTKEQVVALKFAMHLGDLLTARGRLERTAGSNQLMFVLFECSVSVSWESVHPGIAYSCDQSTFYTSADSGSSQTNMVTLQGRNACKHHFNNASCVRGADCQFFHGNACKHHFNNASCVRGADCQFFHGHPPLLDRHPDEYNDLRKEWLAKRLQLKQKVSAIQGDTHDPAEKKLKRARAHVFCDWIVATFGQKWLQQRGGGTVLDVAGGRGDLAFELWTNHNIPCTLVDP
ncbi:hypothetical protein AaE_001987, partial [Aphanomyces astaci]